MTSKTEQPKKHQFRHLKKEMRFVAYAGVENMESLKKIVDASAIGGKSNIPSSFIVIAHNQAVLNERLRTIDKKLDRLLKKQEDEPDCTI